MAVEIFRGDTWVRVWTITVDGAPLDLTGASARMQLRQAAADETALLDVSTGTEDLVIQDPPTSGVISLRTQTDGLTAGKYIFDLQVTFPDGTIQTYEQETLKVKQDVTR